MFGNLLNKFKAILLNKYVASTLRHGLGLLSGYLIAMGVTQDVAVSFTSQLGDIAVNALPGILALVLSYFDKAKK